MSQDNQQHKPPDDPEDKHVRDLDTKSSEPEKELKVNRLKFALILGAILLFALIASNIKEITGG
jgi:hypothetical protein